MTQDQIFAGKGYNLKQDRNKTTKKTNNFPPSNIVDVLSRYLKVSPNMDN